MVSTTVLSVKPFFTIFVVICLYSLCCNAQFLTNLAALNITKSWPAKETTPGLLKIGASQFKESVYDEVNNVVFITNSLVVIRYNMAIQLVNETTITDVDKFRFQNFSGTYYNLTDPNGGYRGDSIHFGHKVETFVLLGLTAPVLTANKEQLILAGQLDNPIRLQKFNARTFDRIGESFDATPINNIVGVATDSDYVYYCTSSKVVRYKYSDESKWAKPDNYPQQLIIPGGTQQNPITITHFKMDTQNGIFFMVTSARDVLKITINNNNFSDSATSLKKYYLSNNSSTIATLDYDKNGQQLLIAYTGKGYGDPGYIIHIDVSGNVIAKTFEVRLGLEDFFISTSAIDVEGGMLYLGNRDVPGRCVQYDFVNKKREGTLPILTEVDPTHGPYLTAALSKTSNRLVFFGANAVTGGAQANMWVPAEACTGNCFGHGNCSRRVCTCDTFTGNAGSTLYYEQPWCELRGCESNCSNNATYKHGTCYNGTCACESIWSGPICSIRQCPGNCTGNGQCAYESDGVTPRECECAPGWSGDDCSSSAKLPCELITECGQCVDNPACGWCASSNLCQYGNIIGPYSTAGCRDWRYQACASIVIDIINYIMTAFVVGIWLLNTISAIYVDSSAETLDRRQDWYRFQRSIKGWGLVGQLQMIGLAGVVNGIFPESIVGFSKYWNWIVLSFGQVNWGTGPDRSQFGSIGNNTRIVVGNAFDAFNTRQLLNVDQYQTYWIAENDKIFYGIIVWVAIALLISIFGLVIDIIAAVIRKGNIGYIVQTRPIYIFCRVLDWSHLGICTLGPIALVKGGSSGSAIAAGVIWIGLGILFPLLFCLFLAIGVVTKKQLFIPEFMHRWWPIYGAYDFRFIKVVWVSWLRRILIGVFLGFLSTGSGVGQCAAVIVISVAHILFVVLVKPFSDYLQTYAEVWGSAVNIISYAFLIPFAVDDVSAITKTALSICFLVSTIIGVVGHLAFYVTSHLQMKQIYSFGQCKDFILCKGDAK